MADQGMCACGVGWLWCVGWPVGRTAAVACVRPHGVALALQGPSGSGERASTCAVPGLSGFDMRQPQAPVPLD